MSCTADEVLTPSETSRGWAKKLLLRLGFRCLRERSLPRGLDVCWDLEQLTGFTDVRHVIDVEANVGQFSKMIRERFPLASVLTCEPTPGAFAILRERFAGDEKVPVEEVALGAQRGTATME